MWPVVLLSVSTRSLLATQLHDKFGVNACSMREMRSRHCCWITHKRSQTLRVMDLILLSNSYLVSST
ncbi:uncharacterized protein PHALS_15451 [Plasmopara halstedii]|uniref:RxLR-like protein n=1 Tax=Plasmopara halstedii TaxID=4781 RepID=A0A0P1AHZ8_PLAHL|nr:uncharacterized protein PHALS_15451 [Plasmopara halstedii]CEG40455.1 hypothetical protein PHALS_15451 [Plasmopara halstedii]|eukprot:XP_024576824.1 hypothetical protein PHALS_15451 [Plasmopara halstedii]